MGSQQFQATTEIARVAKLAAERADDWDSHSELRRSSGHSCLGYTPVMGDDGPYISQDMVIGYVHLSQASYALRLAKENRSYAEVLERKLTVPQLSPNDFRDPKDRAALLNAVANVAPTELDTFRDWVGPPAVPEVANDREKELDGPHQTFRDLLDTE